jgi:hypothetical protein
MFGWRSSDLFGLDPIAPLARYDNMGLIWLMTGGNVVELTSATARFENGLAFRCRDRNEP